MKTANKYEDALLSVAEISAKATIKYLWEKWSMDYIAKLRYGQLADFARLDRERNAVNEIETLEKRITNIDEEMKITVAVMSEIEDVVLNLHGNAYKEKQSELQELNAYIEELHEERKKTVKEIGVLYGVLGERLTDGIDLYQIAVCAVWECLPVIKAYARHGYDVNNAGGMVVECHTIKRTGEKRYLTLKAYADMAVRKYVNQWRSGTASKTQYIIVGHDEEGNELFLQNSKLETLGGVDSWEEKQAFAEMWAELENILTGGQIEVVKLLLQGRTQQEIAKCLKVNQSTVNDKIKRIREKVKNSSIEVAKKF